MSSTRTAAEHGRVGGNFRRPVMTLVWSLLFSFGIFFYKFSTYFAGVPLRGPIISGMCARHLHLHAPLQCLRWHGMMICWLKAIIGVQVMWLADFLNSSHAWTLVYTIRITSLTNLEEACSVTARKAKTKTDLTWSNQEFSSFGITYGVAHRQPNHLCVCCMIVYEYLAKLVDQQICKVLNSGAACLGTPPH